MIFVLTFIPLPFDALRIAEWSMDSIFEMKRSLFSISVFLLKSKESPVIASIAIIAITTKISISVKPFFDIINIYE